MFSVKRVQYMTGTMDGPIGLKRIELTDWSRIWLGRLLQQGA